MRLFAVGDADQSIYEFTGAHPELLRQLAERDDVETVRLRLNYRCGSNIVTASGYALGEERDYEAVDGAEEGTIYFHSRTGQYANHAEYLFTTLLPEIQARHPDLRLGEIAMIYPAAWIYCATSRMRHLSGEPKIKKFHNEIWVSICSDCDRNRWSQMSA